MLGKMKAKLCMLKKLQRQMMSAMADGDGDDEDAGEEAMADLKDDAKVEKKVAAKSEDDDDGDEGFKSFMKRGNKPKVDPKAGAVMVATIRRQGPQGKSQPPKGKKYG